MAESLVVNNVTYPGVEAISMTNAAGREVVFYPGEPNCKTYEITLAKSSGWVLLTTLDAEVLEHINDPDFIVCLKKLGDHSYVNYAGNTYIAGNVPVGYSGTIAVYGASNRTGSETSTSTTSLFYPANKTDTSVTNGGSGMFRINGSKYYLRPGDGYVYPGTYRLTFTW